MEIKVLKKNESLSYLAGINRPINPAQVTKLAESINLIGNIRPLVVVEIDFITGKKTKYIVDGQHLFNALIRNSLPIEYIIIKVKDTVELVERIALLNSSSKSWTLLDYITSWTVISEDYKKLQQYYNIYDFELSFLAGVLMNKNYKSLGGGHINKFIKKGEFKITEENKNVEILDKLTDVLNIIPRLNRQENKFLCTEYVDFLRINLSKYNHKIFLDNLKKNKEKFILATHEQTKLSSMFEKLI
jgi:hypothetical protein